MSTVTGWRKRQIAEEIHSCSPFCTRPMCVAEAIQAEREACAKLAAATICDTHIPSGIKIYGTVAAKAIRARGQTPCNHEWIDATTTKPQWHCAKCGKEYTKEQA
jgi:hypothetical protein